MQRIDRNATSVQSTRQFLGVQRHRELGLSVECHWITKSITVEIVEHDSFWRGVYDAPFCREVHVTYAAPSYRAEYERIFKAQIFFESDKNALLIDATWHDHRIAPKRRGC